MNADLLLFPLYNSVLQKSKSDPVLNSALHLDAYQTPDSEELKLAKMTHLVYYGSIIVNNAVEFKKLSN